MAQKHNVKTPADQSEKAHMPMPPKEISPTQDQPMHPRGETGQFTDKGSPGYQKR